MNKFTISYRRATPACGTYLKVSLGGISNEQAAFAADQAFAQARDLEKIFSRFDPESELSRLHALSVGENTKVSGPLAEVLRLGLHAQAISDGAFNPFFPRQYQEPPLFLEEGLLTKRASFALDLNGIAKGWIVDEAVRVMGEAADEAYGTVEAGGDLRHFGEGAPYSFHVRAGPRASPLLLPVTSPLPACAVSSAAGWHPSARYAPEIAKQVTAAAFAPSATLADAATKIALHLWPEPARLAGVARALGFTILVIDQAGQILLNLPAE